MGLFSCNSDPLCFVTDTDRVVRISFRSLDETKTDTIRTLSISNAAKDVVFIAKDTMLLSVTLPLSPLENKTSYLLETDKGEQLLQLSYDLQLQVYLP